MGIAILTIVGAYGASSPSFAQTSTTPNCAGGNPLVWLSPNGKSYVLTGSELNPSNTALAKGQVDEIPFYSSLLSAKGYKAVCRSEATSAGASRDTSNTAAFTSLGSLGDAVTTMGSGRSTDRAYLKAMVAMHRMMSSLAETEMAKGTSPEVKSAVTKMMAHMREDFHTFDALNEKFVSGG
jgi:hypothetical protein